MGNNPNPYLVTRKIDLLQLKKTFRFFPKKSDQISRFFNLFELKVIKLDALKKLVINKARVQ